MLRLALVAAAGIDEFVVLDALSATEDGPRFMRAQCALKGVRLVLMSETKRGDMIAESIGKMLVDGGEITARYPVGRVFTFQPVFTPILSTNH